MIDSTDKKQGDLKKELLEEQSKITEFNELKQVKKAVEDLLKNDPDFVEGVLGDDIVKEHDRAAISKQLES